MLSCKMRKEGADLVERREMLICKMGREVLICPCWRWGLASGRFCASGEPLTAEHSEASSR